MNHIARPALPHHDRAPSHLRAGRHLLAAALLVLPFLGTAHASAASSDDTHIEEAQGLSYNFVEIRRSRRSFSDFLGLAIEGGSSSIRTGDAEGWGLAGSVALGERFYLTGQYDEYDDLGLALGLGGFFGIFDGAGSLEESSGRLMLGLRLPVGRQFEINAEIGAEIADYRIAGTVLLENPDGGLTATGVVDTSEVEPSARLGFRYRVRRFELAAGARYSSLQPGDLILRFGEDSQFELEDDVIFDANALFHFDFGLGLGLGVEIGEVETLRFLTRWSF